MGRLQHLAVFLLSLSAAFAQEEPRCTLHLVAPPSAGLERILAAVARQWPGTTIVRDAAVGTVRAGSRRLLAVGDAAIPAALADLPRTQLTLREPLEQLLAKAQQLWPQRAACILEAASAVAVARRCNAQSVLVLGEGVLPAAALAELLVIAREREMPLATTIPALTAQGAALVVQTDAARCAAALLPSLKAGQSASFVTTATYCTGNLGALRRTGALLNGRNLGAFDEILTESTP